MTMFKDVIELINVVIITDELLQQIETETLREVFANKKSIAQSEFFSAGQSGIKANQCFVIRVGDYEGEQSLLFNGKKFSIYRVYEKGENVELYCEVRTGGN